VAQYGLAKCGWLATPYFGQGKNSATPLSGVAFREKKEKKKKKIEGFLAHRGWQNHP
jgi:hypothetical protein